MNRDIFPSHNFEKKRIWLALIPPLIFVFLLWIIEVIKDFSWIHFNFSALGIYPLSVSGLSGIIFSPLIHASVSHLFSNTIPLLILSWCVFYFYRGIAYKVIGLLWLLSGLLTWIIGRNAYHAGASGLIFALFSFLFFSGIFRKYIPLIAVSMFVVFIYGSSIWSIFPIAELVDKAISWEGHLSGVFAGLVAAVVFRKQGPQKPPELFDDEAEELSTDDDDIESA